VIDGKFYLAWGRTDAVDVYDPVTDSWRTVLPETPDSECAGSCITFSAGGTVFRGQLYSIGGFSDDNESAGVFAFDPVTNLWGQKANMNVDRDNPVAGAVRNAAGQSRIVMVAGSVRDGGFGTVGETEMYKP
jgi:hypothetical protein